MELVKKNIHTDRIYHEAGTQFTLEEDVNIPDLKLDVERLVFYHGTISIEDIRAAEGQVSVRGTLNYHILYQSEEEGSILDFVDGKIPFEEQLQMEGVTSADRVDVIPDVEDFSVGVINSRKLSIQALLHLKAMVEDMYDEQIATGCQDESNMECLKKEVEMTHIAVCKKDVFRIREEINLPHNLPNLKEIIWKHIRIGEMEFKCSEHKLTVQGEVQLLVLYTTDGDMNHIQMYETTLPFSNALDCQGVTEAMISDICYRITSEELEIHEDYDGEDRVLGLEIVMELSIKLYEKETETILCDVYGIQEEIQPITKDACYSTLLCKKCGKEKVNGSIKLEQPELPLGQIIYGDGQVVLEEVSKEPGELVLQGSIPVKIMYKVASEQEEYAFAEGTLPFSYKVELNQCQEPTITKTNLCIHQLSAVRIAEDEIEIKVILGVQLMVFAQICEKTITELLVTPPDMAKRNELPSMVGCFINEGDSLWEIGKKYYVPLKQIREINHLSGDTVKPGDKLLVVRGM